MEINLEMYKVFYYVAKNLSFSEASKALFLSQSAVSQNIKALETKLDVTLFHRSTKRVSLTSDGELLLQHIEPAIHLIRSGEASLAEARDLSKGSLHIAASDTICRYYLVPYLEKYHRAYPHIDIKVTNRTSLTGIQLLDQGAVDLVATNLPNESISKDMQTYEARTFQDVFVANRTYSELAGRKLAFSELLEHPILMLEKNSTTSRYLYQLSESKGLDIHPAIELGSIDLLVDLARIGLGISFVPDYMLADGGDGLFTIELSEPIPSRRIGIATNKRFPLSLAANAFLEMVVPEMR